MHTKKKMKVPYLSLLMILALASFSCSSEKAGDANKQGPTAAPAMPSGPVASGGSAGGSGQLLEIEPKEAFKTTTLSAVLRGSNPADSKMQWLINGRPAPEHTGMQFKCADAKKGDVIQCGAISGGVEIKSNEVVIRNTPPEIVKVRLVPQGYKQGEPFSVDVTGSDADGDQVTFLYEWTKNGEPAGKTDKLEGAVKRGDKISLKITPFDGEAYGRPRVVNTGISNMPPVITQHNDYSFDGKVLTYQLKASDPDGDPITCSLKSAPAGMVIDPKTGLLTWKVPADFKGKTSCVISVKDGQGGETDYTLNIDMGVIKK